MTNHGSRTCRFAGTRESAWEIINCLDLNISHQRRRPLQIQEEMVDRGLPLHETTAAKTLFRFLVQLPAELKRAWGKLHNRAGRASNSKGHPRQKPFSTSPTIRPNSSVVAPSTGIAIVASPDSASLPSPADSISSGCSVTGYQDTLSAAIRALELAYEVAEIGHIPLLRGIIETVLHIARTIEVSSSPLTILLRP